MSEANQDQKQPAETNQTQALTQSPRRELRVVNDDSQLSYMLDTARFDHTYRIAGAMARASLIPKHLKGATFEETQANCFLVVNQSLRWGLDPFVVMASTYEVGGKLGFEGKLIAAVINARGNLMERLSYEFNDGKGDALEITVSGRITGEKKARTVTVSVGQARTTNQMWTKDPHQKLIYNGAIKWARRHMPEIILGIISDDDAEAIRQEQRFIEAGPAKSPSFPGMPAVTSTCEATIDTKTGESRIVPGSEKTIPIESKVEATPAKESPPIADPVTRETPAPTPAAKTPPDDGSDLFDAEETKTPTQLDELKRLMNEKEIPLVALLGFCQQKKLMIEGATVPFKLEHIKPEKLVTLCGHIANMSATGKAIKEWKAPAAN